MNAVIVSADGEAHGDPSKPLIREELSRGSTVAPKLCRSAIPMMKAADLWDGNDFAL
jgi:hypothetical protein